MIMLDRVPELEKALQFVGLGQGQAAGGNTEAGGGKKRRRRSISRWREGRGISEHKMEANKYWPFKYCR